MHHTKEFSPSSTTTILLSPRYQFLDEFVVTNVDYFDLYQTILEKNRNENKKTYQYVKCSYYQQIVLAENDSDTSKMHFSADLYVDLTDLKNLKLYMDDFSKRSYIQESKMESFYKSAKLSPTSGVSFSSFINHLFFPQKKLKKRQYDVSTSQSESIGKINLRKAKNNSVSDRKLAYRNSDSIITSLEYLLEINSISTKNVMLTSPFINIVVNQADSVNSFNTFLTSESEMRMNVHDKNKAVFGFQYIVINELLTADEFKKKAINEIKDFDKFVEEAEDTGNTITPLIRSIRVDF